MSENTIKDNPARKVLFGTSLLKPKVISEPQAENKPERLLENDTESVTNLAQKEDNALQCQIFSDTTVTTNIPAFMTVEKISLLVAEINNGSSVSSTSHEENTNVKLKKPLDPFTPKKPSTPFISWSMGEREKLKIELGNISVGEVGKELRKRWAALNPEIKQAYQDKYRKEKDKYDKGNNSCNTLAEVPKMKAGSIKKEEFQKRKLNVSNELKGKRPKKNIDSAAPKKPLSAFLEWSKVQREKIKAQMGNPSIVDMVKELGKRWTSEAAPVKHFYEEIYKENKDKYDKDVANYKICQSSNNLSENSGDQEVSLDSLKIKKTVARGQEGVYMKALRPRKINYFNNCGLSENQDWGSDMVKPYFRFVEGNWRGSAKTVEKIIPDAGPLDVIDFLNQMWGEQGDIVKKYLKPVSKKPRSKRKVSSSKDRAEDKVEQYTDKLNEHEDQDNEPEM